MELEIIMLSKVSPSQVANVFSPVEYGGHESKGDHRHMKAETRCGLQEKAIDGAKMIKVYYMYTWKCHVCTINIS